MIKKRKGSSMITVLGVTLVLVFLSGIILSLTMGTMKANTNQKEVEDVQFAAEGGVELARSYLQAKATPPKNSDGSYPIVPESEFEIDTETAVSGSVVAELTKELEKDKIENVAIKTENIGRERVLITSVAKAVDGRKKTVKCKVQIYKANENNIFDYGIVGGQGNVNISNSGGGQVNLGSTTVSSSSLFDENGNELNSIPADKDGKKPPISQNRFGDLTFLTNDPPLKKIKAEYSGDSKISVSAGKFYEVGSSGNHIRELEPTIIEADLAKPDEMIIDGIVYPLTSLGNKNNIPSTLDLKHIVLMKIKGHGIYTYMEVLLANADHIILEAKGTSLQLYNTIILNKGIVEFAGTGSIKIVDSTIYSEDIRASLTSSFEVIGSINEVTLTGAFTKENQEKLDAFLQAILPGWNDVTNSSAQGVLVVDGSYDNG